jgi:hypothetical protein
MFPAGCGFLDVFADVIQHPDFGIPAAEQLLIQIVCRRFVARQKPLQRKAGARAFHQYRSIIGS